MSDLSTQQKLLVGAEEAAEMMCLSQAQFRKAVKDGVAPAPIQQVGHPRWKTADIREHLARPVPPLQERRPKSVPLGPDVCHLYRHFDKAGRLLYVGISLSAVARLADHKKASPWFWDISRIEVTAYRTRAAALKAERISIQREKPLHNVVHNRREAA